METKLKTTNKNTTFPKLKLIIKSDRNKLNSPMKNKNLNDSKSSLSPESKALKNMMKIEDNKKINEKDINIQRRGVPKNVNQYRHIIETMHRDSDVEWIIELRSHKKMPPMYKHTLHTFPPKFYDQDFEEYKSKTAKDILEKNKNPLTLKRNLGEYEHLINKIGMPANSIQFGFDSTLRTLMEKDKYSYFNEKPWRPLNMSPKKDILNTVLAPTSRQGIENLKKISDYVIRPYERVGDIYSMNDQKIKRRKFLPSPIANVKFAGEHNSSTPYSTSFNAKNLNEIRHIMNDHINMSHWGSELRHYEKSK